MGELRLSIRMKAYATPLENEIELGLVRAGGRAAGRPGRQAGRQAGTGAAWGGTPYELALGLGVGGGEWTAGRVAVGSTNARRDSTNSRPVMVRPSLPAAYSAQWPALPLTWRPSAAGKISELPPLQPFSL